MTRLAALPVKRAASGATAQGALVIIGSIHHSGRLAHRGPFVWRLLEPEEAKPRQFGDH